MDWLIVPITSIGGALVGLVTGGLIAYQKYRSIMAEARAKDAAIQADEDERVVKQWESFNAELRDHFNCVLEKLETEVRELKVENDKRREEHFKCQTENVVMKNQIEDLKKANSDLRDRVVHLEAKG